MAGLGAWEWERARGSVSWERESGNAKLCRILVPRRFILWVINRSPLVNVFPVTISDLVAHGRVRAGEGAWDRDRERGQERGRERDWERRAAVSSFLVHFCSVFR